MKRFSDKIGPFSIALAFLMPVAIESALLAEVVPEVVGERKEKSSLDDDIKQLKKEAEEAEKLKNYSQAIDLYERILILENERIIRDGKSGKNKKYWHQHPARFTLRNLARLYKRQGIYDKAETLYLRLLSIDEKAIGPENPNTASTLMDLATLYKLLGNYSKAEPLYLRSLSI